MKFEIGQDVIIYDRYRYGGNGIPATVIKRQQRKDNEPEYECEIVPQQSGIPWPPCQDKNKISWYCENQLRSRN